MSTDDLIRRITAIPSFASIALVALLGTAAAYSLWRAVRDHKVRTPAAVLFAATAAPRTPPTPHGGSPATTSA